MSSLNIDKTNWKIVRLGDLASEVSDRVENPSTSRYERFVGLGNFVSGDLKIKSWESTSSLASSAKAFKAGDILFARRNAYLKRASMVDFEGCCSGDAFVLRENPEKVVPGFLPFLMNSTELWNYANANAAGTMSKRVKWRDLAKYEFLLPPKDQQAELAELLWAMDYLVEIEEKLLDTLKTALVVTNKNNVDFGYDSRGRALPSGWVKKKISSVAKVQSGSTPLRSNLNYFKNGTFHWIKTLDLNNGIIKSSEEMITELALKETSCKLRPIGSVLVAMYGGFNQIGRTGILQVEAATNQALSAILTDNTIIDPEYLLIVLNTKRNYWKKVAISSRKDPNITKNDIENFPVPIPPLQEQAVIIKKSKTFERSIKMIERKVTASRALKKSIINQIF